LTCSILRKSCQEFRLPGEYSGNLSMTKGSRPEPRPLAPFRDGALEASGTCSTMTLLKPISLCLLTAMAAFAVWGEASCVESFSLSVFTHAEKSDDSSSDSASAADYGGPEKSEFRDRKMVQIPTDQIVQKYYSETLSVIPALMFSPIALQLAFTETINAPIDEHNNTLLHVASRSGDVFAAWQLLELGADPRTSNRFHQMPVHVVYSGNSQISEALTAAFSSHQDAIVEVLFRRTASETPVAPRPVSSRRSAETSTTAGITIGMISR